MQTPRSAPPLEILWDLYLRNLKKKIQKQVEDEENLLGNPQKAIRPNPDHLAKPLKEKQLEKKEESKTTQKASESFLKQISKKSECETNCFCDLREKEYKNKDKIRPKL